MQPETAMLRFENSRKGFLQAIAGLNPEILESQPVEGIWTARDLLAHLASWESTVLEPLKAYLNGAEFKPEQIDDELDWNDLQAAHWEQLPLGTIQADFTQVRYKLEQLLLRLRPEDWQHIWLAPWGGEATLAEMIDGLAWHEEEHTKSVLHWRQSEANI